MDKETLYWILSTIPQVSAALVAFIGFLGLYALEEPSRRRAEVENNARRYIRETRSTPGLGVDIFTRPPYSQLEVVSGSQLMTEVKSLLKDSHPKRGAALELENYFNSWRELDSRIKRLNRLLVAFVVWHLVLILASLSLLPNLSLIEGVSGLGLAFTLVAIGMAASVGKMVYEALTMRAQERQESK